MKTTIMTIAVLVALVSAPAFAGNIALSAPRLQGVGVFPDGTAFILLDPANPISTTSDGLNPSCGTNTDPGQIRFSTNTVGGAEMYRTALAAFLAGRSLVVNVAASNSCFGVFPLASFVFVQ